jgi:hypothetical protein
MPEAYTLVTVLDDLKKKGYTLDFNIAFDKLQCVQNGVCLNPEQFEIVEHFRFEGDSNPDDQSILYAVESKDGKLKGVLVNAYGIYSDPVSDEMLQKLSAQK